MKLHQSRSAAYLLAPSRKTTAGQGYSNTAASTVLYQKSGLKGYDYAELRSDMPFGKPRVAHQSATSAGGLVSAMRPAAPGKHLYRHLSVSALSRLQQVEEERAWLTQSAGGFLARPTHPVAGSPKTILGPARPRELHQWFRDTFSVSGTRVCRLVQLRRAPWYQIVCTNSVRVKRE